MARHTGCRVSFVKRFGEDAARRIEQAADSHRNGIHDEPGSDYFRWAVCIVLGHQCVERDSYREYHGIETPTWDEFKQWVKDEAHLEDHDGDVDFLAMFAGVYNEFMPEKQPDA